MRIEPDLTAGPLRAARGRFLAGGDSREATLRRNNAFKLIPRVSEGSWIIKQSVGTTPCLLGNKLTARYFQCVPPACAACSLCAGCALLARPAVRHSSAPPSPSGRDLCDGVSAPGYHCWACSLAVSSCLLQHSHCDHPAAMAAPAGVICQARPAAPVIGACARVGRPANGRAGSGRRIVLGAR